MKFAMTMLAVLALSLPAFGDDTTRKTENKDLGETTVETKTDRSGKTTTVKKTKKHHKGKNAAGHEQEVETKTETKTTTDPASP
jgi:hypothetical protein